MVAGFWTLDLTTITGQSAFILRHHTAAVSSYGCTFDDLELVHQSLRTLEPPHTHKFPRVNAQDCKLGPIQPWDVKDGCSFFRLRVSSRCPSGARRLFGASSFASARASTVCSLPIRKAFSHWTNYANACRTYGGVNRRTALNCKRSSTSR